MFSGVQGTPKSKENPITNRARDQTLSDASFLSLLEPSGQPRVEKALRRVPHGLPKDLQNGPRIGSESVLGLRGGPMISKGIKMIQNESRMNSK